MFVEVLQKLNPEPADMVQLRASEAQLRSKVAKLQADAAGQPLQQTIKQLQQAEVSKALSHRLCSYCWFTVQYVSSHTLGASFWTCMHMLLMAITSRDCSPAAACILCLSCCQKQTVLWLFLMSISEGCLVLLHCSHETCDKECIASAYQAPLLT